MSGELLSFKTFGVISQGVDCIADNRTFFLETYTCGSRLAVPLLRPPTLSQFEMNVNGQSVEILGTVNDNSPLSCQHCGEVFTRGLLDHNAQWMNSVLFCNNHPLNVLLDVFPKRDCSGFNTRYDWFNAYKGFGLQNDLPPGVIIKPYRSPDEEYHHFLKTTPPTFYLTPTGLIAIEPSSTLTPEQTNFRNNPWIQRLKEATRLFNRQNR